jgi:hypothetical protein
MPFKIIEDQGQDGFFLETGLFQELKSLAQAFLAERTRRRTPPRQALLGEKGPGRFRAGDAYFFLLSG